LKQFFGGGIVNIGNKLKQRRKELKMTMLEVSKKVNVSEATISRWESGDIANMKRDKIALLAKALQVTPAYIMGWEDEASQKKNDAITDIILKMRRDENLLEAIRELCELSPEHISAVKAFITVLKQQHINNVK
jgi:transcriptional regulator with XRE-family HTH domain